MSIALDIRIQQLTAQRSMVQYRMVQSVAAVHRIAFTGRTQRPEMERAYIMNGLLAKMQLDMINEELRTLKRQRRLDFYA